MITARLIIEIAGFPKEHIESVMKGVMEQIKASNDVLSYDIYEAKEVEQMWSTFTEMEINFKELKDLIAFCFDNSNEPHVGHAFCSSIISRLIAMRHVLQR